MSLARISTSEGTIYNEQALNCQQSLQSNSAAAEIIISIAGSITVDNRHYQPTAKSRPHDPRKSYFKMPFESVFSKSSHESGKQAKASVWRGGISRHVRCGPPGRASARPSRSKFRAGRQSVPH
jgi:hypothetical protein